MRKHPTIARIFSLGCQSPVGKYAAQPLDYEKTKAYILTFTNTCWRAMWKNETRERWYIPRQPLSICKQTIPMTQTCSWKPGWVNTKEPSPSIGFVTAQWFSACVSKQGVEEVKQGKLERTEHFKSEWWWDCHGFCSCYIAQFYTHTSFPLQNQKGWPPIKLLFGRSCTFLYSTWHDWQCRLNIHFCRGFHVDVYSMYVTLLKCWLLIF